LLLTKEFFILCIFIIKSLTLYYKNEIMKKILSLFFAILDNGKEHENWERWVNSLYLNIVTNGLDNMSADNTNKLSYLAQQCPAATGPAVYKARSLMAMLVPALTYEDDAACAAMLPPSKGGKNPYKEEQDLLDGMSAEDENMVTVDLNEFKIYPNPIARQSDLTLLYNIPENDNAICIITDITGKQVSTIDLQGGKRRVVTTISDLSAGVYIIKVISSNREVYKQKLNVVD
jgi:hypothetical protein